MGDSTNILLVDDEKAIVMLLTEVLKRENYQVTSFTDAEEALSDFNDNSAVYDLVITDQNMPKMTGTELSKKLQEVKPGIPIILCSGDNESGDNTSAEETGITTYLVKPVKNADMVNEVKSILS